MEVYRIIRWGSSQGTAAVSTASQLRHQGISIKNKTFIAAQTRIGEPYNNVDYANHTY